MTEVKVRCVTCGMENVKDLSPREIDSLRKMTSGVVEIEVIEEVLHHMNAFSSNLYNHGRFTMEVGNEKLGLLEVTRDFDARPIFYRGGVRL